MEKAFQVNAATRRRLYLVRHAEVSYFDADGKPLHPLHVALTKVGRGQAEVLGVALQRIHFDQAVCSGILRTRETAEIVLQGRTKVSSDAAFSEVRGGRLASFTHDGLVAEISNPYGAAFNSDAQFLGGERFVDFEQRVLHGLQFWFARTDWSHLLLVARDAVNRIILGWALGIGRNALATTEQDFCCLNIIDVPRASQDKQSHNEPDSSRSR